MAFTFNPFTGNFDALNPPPYVVISVAANTNAAANTTYLVDSSAASRVITLPAPALNAFVVVKDSTGSSETNSITINPNSSEDIDGQSSLVLNSNFGSYLLVSDGTNWFVI